MNRQKFTDKLVRMIHKIEAGETPVPVRELYVFGSFARGAKNPQDLDIVVIHEPPDKSVLARIEEECVGKGKDWLDNYLMPDRRFQTMMRQAFRKPGERVDILLGVDVEKAISSYIVCREELVLLWSKKDQDWKSKLEGIRMDPEAQSAPRNHLVDIRRARCDREELEAVTKMVQAGELNLSRLLIDEIALEDLLPYYCEALEENAQFPKVHRIGKKTLETLPYAMWWFQVNECIDFSYDKTEIWDDQRVCRVQIGVLRFYEMIDLFHLNQDLDKQCLIPHFKRGEVNELLVFERGKQWGHHMNSTEESESDICNIDSDEDHNYIINCIGELDLSLESKQVDEEGHCGFTIHISHSIIMPFIPMSGMVIRLGYDKQYTTWTLLDLVINRIVWDTVDECLDAELEPVVLHDMKPEELIRKVWSYRDAGFFVQDNEVVNAIQKGELPSFRKVLGRRLIGPRY